MLYNINIIIKEKSLNMNQENLNSVIYVLFMVTFLYILFGTNLIDGFVEYFMVRINTKVNGTKEVNEVVNELMNSLKEHENKIYSMEILSDLLYNIFKEKYRFDFLVNSKKEIYYSFVPINIVEEKYAYKLIKKEYPEINLTEEEFVKIFKFL